MPEVVEWTFWTNWRSAEIFQDSKRRDYSEIQTPEKHKVPPFIEESIFFKKASKTNVHISQSHFRVLSLTLFQELLGLGLELPGMTSRGTMEREDDLPASLSRLKGAGAAANNSQTSVTSSRDADIRDFHRTSSASGVNFRQTLSVRPELEADLGSNNGSEIMNESVVSSLTDR